MTKPNWSMRACGVILLWAAGAVGLSAQTAAGVQAAAASALPMDTYSLLSSFNGTNGGSPYGGVIQGFDGNLYGVTEFGGSNACFGPCGTVYKITADGTVTTLHDFQGPDGERPLGTLVQGADGNFYGTTYYGGSMGLGTIFKIAPSGTLTTIHVFIGHDGEYPEGGLIQGADGALYGTTEFGGTNVACENEDELVACGTIFKITTDGTFTTLHDFAFYDGGAPRSGLSLARDGNFYGTTYAGGNVDGQVCELNDGCGTIFRMTPAGAFTSLYSFCPQAGACVDGAAPLAGLVQGTGGSLYGTAADGGSPGDSCDFGCGTIFKITPAGAFTTIYSFCSGGGFCSDGADPEAGLALGTDGNLYGVTDVGGASGVCAPYEDGCGTIFGITPSGAQTTLYSFVIASGGFPFTNPLVQDTNGTFYGTTDLGGANSSCNSGEGCGVVFTLSTGLGPFVEPAPQSGAVGSKVRILGSGLKGTTMVTFHGVSAAFTVVSKSEITTTVPAGATNGSVKVITPTGTLSSNVPFRVN